MNKKHIIIVTIAAVAIFIVGYFVGDTMAINRVNGTVSQSVETTTTPVESVASAKEESKEESKVSTKVGEEATSGSWSIKILDAKEATSVQSGDSSDNKTTKEKFIILKLQMKNITQIPVQYSPGEFTLGDTKTKSQYNVNFDALQAANGNETIYKQNGDFIGVYNDVNPNMPKQTYIIFEVPKSFNIAEGVMINANNSGDPVGYYIK